MATVASIVDALAYALLGWYAIMWTICLFGLWRAYVMFVKVTVPSTSALSAERIDSLPGVSILRPLSGLDSNLHLNLCSTFTQDYPAEKVQVIFSVANGEDQAVPVAREVIDRFKDSGIQCRLVVGDVAAGVNPKVNNLLRPYSYAKHDLLWVLDSQVRLSPGTLLASVLHIISPPTRPSPTALRKPAASRVGLIHHVPLGINPNSRSLGSLVERAFLSTTHAKMYIAINSLAIDSCVMGKSNLWRKSDLERVPDRFFAVNEHGSRKGDGDGALGSEAFRLAYGDDPASSNESVDHDQPLENEYSKRAVLQRSRALGRFSIYLAEDNMLALSLWKEPLSLGHALGTSSACVARTNVGDIRTLADYIARRSRWIRVRRYMVPAATYAEPLTESIVVGLLGLSALSRFGRVQSIGDTILFLILHFALWLIVDLCVLGILEGSAAPEQEPLLQHDITPATQPTRPTTPAYSRVFSTRADLLIFIGAWCLREFLAFPIWAYAMYGGNEVIWRGQPYRILSDSRAAKMARRTRKTRPSYEALPTSSVA